MRNLVQRYAMKQISPLAVWRDFRRDFAAGSRNNGNTMSYIDEWFASIVKPASFYEENAAPGLKRKKYFYNIDLQGRVFLEDTLPKNIATSIKNVQFLDFFFTRIRKIKDHERDLLSQLGVDDHYPLSHDNEGSMQTLGFGGSLKQPFDPSCLAMSRYTGRLYHELIIPSAPSKRKETTPLHKSLTREFGLIRSSVAVVLSEHIFPADTNDVDVDVDAYSGMIFDRPDAGVRFSIPWLPEEAEPGPWAMPFIEVSE